MTRTVVMIALWIGAAGGTARAQVCPGEGPVPSNPVVGLAGDRALVMWRADDELEATLQDRAGATIDQRLAIPGPRVDLHVAAGPPGRQLLVGLRTEFVSLVATLLDADGAVVAGPISIAEDASVQSLDAAFDGAGYVVVWSTTVNAGNEVWLARLSADGSLIAAPRQLADREDGGATTAVAVTSNQTVTWVMWSENVYKTVGVRLAPDGSQLDPAAVLLADFEHPLDAASNGGTMVVMVGDTFAGYGLIVLGDTATPPGPPVPVFAENFPRVAPFGTGFLVVETGYDERSDLVRAQAVDAAIVPLGPPWVLGPGARATVAGDAAGARVVAIHEDQGETTYRVMVTSSAISVASGPGPYTSVFETDDLHFELDCPQRGCSAGPGPAGLASVLLALGLVGRRRRRD